MFSSLDLVFHPGAIEEYAEAARYYMEKGSRQVALRFIAEVEESIAAMLIAPHGWRIVEPPEIRRYFVHRFPYALYYVWEPESRRATVYALMHLARMPGYWRSRVSP